MAKELSTNKSSTIDDFSRGKATEPQHRATVYGRCGICVSHQSMGYIFFTFTIVLVGVGGWVDKEGVSGGGYV